MMDEAQRLILEEAGVPLGLLPDEFEGAAWNVAIIWEGALDDEWLVESLGVAEAQLDALWAAWEPDGHEVLITATHVYVGPDTIEASGYGPYPRREWNTGG